VEKTVSRWGKGRGGRPWRRLVEAVKRRDQYTCQACGRVTEDGECDHIVPTSKGGKTEMGNLQWLCSGPNGCHLKKTQREAAEAQGRTLKVEIGVDGWPVG
jgi:5-methylcytosine-specific restriction protein A